MSEEELDQLIAAMEGLLAEIRAATIPHTMA